MSDQKQAAEVAAASPELTATVSKPDRTREQFDRCVEQARDICAAAEVLIEKGGLDHIAFGNAVLGFEELGKAAMIAMASVVADASAEKASKLLDRADDHGLKLFWAFWSPWGNRQSGEVEKINEMRDIASKLHGSRLEAMYADPNSSRSPRESVDRQFAESTVRLLRTQVELTASTGLGVVSPEKRELYKWFLEAADDPDKSRFIFSPASIKKRAELGRSMEWVAWLKSEIDAAESGAQKAGEMELSRDPAASETPDKPRWRMTLRLRSDSHSIRPKTFDEFNSKSKIVRFRPDSNDRRLVVAELELPDRIGVASLWYGGLYHTHRMLVALNAATFGFFWWDFPARRTQYFERLIDLEGSHEVHMSPNPAPVISWANQALKPDAVADFASVYAGILLGAQKVWDPIIRPYVDAMSIAAKTDIHLQGEASALSLFGKAFGAAATEFGDGKSPSEVAQEMIKHLPPVTAHPEKESQLQRWVDAAQGGYVDEAGITLNDVIAVKVLADVMVIKGAGLTVAKRRAEAKAGQPGTTGNPGSDG